MNIGKTRLTNYWSPLEQLWWGGYTTLMEGMILNGHAYAHPSLWLKCREQVAGSQWQGRRRQLAQAGGDGGLDWPRSSGDVSQVQGLRTLGRSSWQESLVTWNWWRKGRRHCQEKSWLVSFIMMRGSGVGCGFGMSSLLPSLGFLSGRHHIRKAKSTPGWSS